MMLAVYAPRTNKRTKSWVFQKKRGVFEKKKLSFSEKSWVFPPKKVGSLKKSWVLSKMSGV